MKKGAALWNQTGITGSLADSGVSWFYGWSADPGAVSAPTGVEFVPMIWGAASTNAAPDVDGRHRRHRPVPAGRRDHRAGPGLSRGGLTGRALLALHVEQVFDERMRWDGQRLDVAAAGEREGTLDLPGVGGAIRGRLRTVTTPEFAGIRFHEVLARSALNAVPGGPMPFGWTINPYRGCSHACVYCFARGTHRYLELDPGPGFDSEVVVKVNLVDVLRRELARPSWRREHVAMGTNTDPYQRAEGRYRLMPGVIQALADNGTPLSILTKGTLLRRDLPLLAAAAGSVPVGIGVSIAIWDDALHGSLEPGAPSPRARLELVSAIRAAGLPCGVFLAPVVPWLTDSLEQLDTAIGAIAAAGAGGVTVVPMHLRPGAREWFFTWLEREHPELVGPYRRLYGRGTSASKEYRRRLAARVAPLVRRHGLARPRGGRGVPDDPDSSFPAGSLPEGAERDAGQEQLTLL